MMSMSMSSTNYKIINYKTYGGRLELEKNPYPIVGHTKITCSSKIPGSHRNL